MIHDCEIGLIDCEIGLIDCEIGLIYCEIGLIDCGIGLIDCEIGLIDCEFVPSRTNQLIQCNAPVTTNPTEEPLFCTAVINRESYLRNFRLRY